MLVLLVCHEKTQKNCSISVILLSCECSFITFLYCIMYILPISTHMYMDIG